MRSLTSGWETSTSRVAPGSRRENEDEPFIVERYSTKFRQEALPKKQVACNGVHDRRHVPDCVPANLYFPNDHTIADFLGAICQGIMGLPYAGVVGAGSERSSSKIDAPCAGSSRGHPSSHCRRAPRGNTRHGQGRTHNGDHARSPDRAGVGGNRSSCPFSSVRYCRPLYCGIAAGIGRCTQQPASIINHRRASTSCRWIIPPRLGSLPDTGLRAPESRADHW
jgi:hypothetical protein